MDITFLIVIFYNLTSSLENSHVDENLFGFFSLCIGCMTHIYIIVHIWK